jgi:hypothetical protein
MPKTLLLRARENGIKVYVRYLAVLDVVRKWYIQVRHGFFEGKVAPTMHRHSEDVFIRSLTTKYIGRPIPLHTCHIS